MSMKDLVKLIACSIVDSPEEVEVTETEGDCTVILELKSAKDDTGKIIGKGGRTVSAIRTILGGIGGKEKKRFVLEIKE